MTMTSLTWHLNLNKLVLANGNNNADKTFDFIILYHDNVDLNYKSGVPFLKLHLMHALLLNTNHLCKRIKQH